MHDKELPCFDVRGLISTFSQLIIPAGYLTTSRDVGVYCLDLVLPI